MKIVDPHCRTHQWARGIRLAFFDVDGTLIGQSGQYSTRTQTAITALQRQGITTAIASGRPPFAARFLFEELNLIHTGLFYAGACLYHPARDQYLYTQPLEGDVAGLIDTVESLGLYAEAYTRDAYWTPVDNAIYRAHSRILHREAHIGPLGEARAHGPIMKLLVGTDRRQQAGADSIAQLQRQFPGYQFAYAKMASHPEWLFANILSPKADRAAGFERLCRLYQVDASAVIAFGDSQSDQAFLEKAGTGVAMGDAPVDVQAAADIVTTSAEEEGVARVLEHLIALRGSSAP